jgi:M-phase inducer tyrosine phosphatase
MSMRKSGNMDYFAMQPVAGSSPTASLAADMSSNLHVDQSPQLATPRRSLFTSSLFQQVDAQASEGVTTPPVRWEGVTTPPIPDSSPSFVPDSMDISPLPHKAPFHYITLPSPSPEVMLNNGDDMLSPCEMPQLPANMADIPRPSSAADRKKSILLRPSLSRTKNFSTNTVSFKQQEQQPCPPFRFGAGCDGFGNVGNTSSPSLDECFAPSPPQERRPCSNGSLFASSKAKPFPFGSNISSRNNGSPLAAIRKQSAAHSRPRPSKMRRSLSMFEHPGDVMNAKQDDESHSPSGLQSTMETEESPSLKLPHFTPPEPESLPRIDHATLIQVLDGAYDHLYDEKAVIDCRFEYEYNGGHIEGALNFCDKEQLAERLFSTPSTTNTLLILHCEYSAHRAPLM